MRDTEDKSLRREFLGVGLTGAMVGLAGCSALPDGTDLSGDESDSDDPDSDDPDSDDSNSGDTDSFNYTKYLIDPEELDIDNYYFTHAKPKLIADNEEYFDEDVYEGDADEIQIAVKDRFEIVGRDFGFDFDEITNIIEYRVNNLSKINVLTIEPDVMEDIEEGLMNEADVIDDIGGYEIIAGTVMGGEEGGERSVSERIGINTEDNKIISAIAANPFDTVELIIDAESGEEDRYADEYESFEVLTNNLDTGARVGGRGFDEPAEEEDFPGLDNVVGVGDQLTVNGETSEDKVVYVHEDAEDVDAEDTREFVEDEGFFEEANEFSVTTNGRAAIVTAEFDTDELEYIV